jgi:hypothetical protein
MEAAEPLKHWFPTIKLHGATSQKTTISISPPLKPRTTHQYPVWVGNNAVDTSL